MRRRSVLLPVLLAAAAALPPAASRAQATAVVAYPGPGWRAASPRTAITVHGVQAGRLRGMRVTGARSGRHRGAVVPLRMGEGAVFTPAVSFAPGERVRVTVPGGPRYAFRVARPAGRAAADDDPGGDAVARASRAARPQVRRCTPPAIRYKSRPHLRPVSACVMHPAARTASPGYLLVTPKTPPEAQQALMMLGNRGRIVWYSRRKGFVRDLKVVTVGGRRYLAYFQDVAKGIPYHALMDEHYRIVRRIRPGNGYRPDMHDFQVTPQGTAYVGAYQRVRVPVAGVQRRVIDYILQELDIATGQVLFEWHALDHVPLDASYRVPPTPDEPWDYFHGNAFEPPLPGDPTILLSSRNTSAVYGIDRGTGAIRWVLGGAMDSFGLIKRTADRFCAQHDVRRLPDGDLTVFDNGGLGKDLDPEKCPIHPARVERWRLRGGRAELVSSIPSGPSSETGGGYETRGLGSARLQPNGDTLISWGTAGRITEVTPRGRVVLGLELGTRSYRAVRARWVGQPRGRPAIAIRHRGGQRLDVYASWNGATRIRSWRVLAGSRRSKLTPVGHLTAFAGLETRIRVHTRARFVAVRALDGHGHHLGRSAAKRARR